MGLNQLCGCGGIYTDSQGLLYVSDTYNYRILLYNITAGSVMLIAGTNGILGTQADQLSVSGSIYVDENQTVFVVDQESR